MNFTILLFVLLIAFGFLWVSAKFFGKTGLIAYVAIMYLFNLALVQTVDIFGSFVALNNALYIPAVFGVFLIFKKYGLSEALKTILIVFMITIFHALIFMLWYFYLSYPFFKSLEYSILPGLIALLAMTIGVGLAYWLFAIKNLFNKFNDSFKAFLIIIIALFADTFIYVLLGGIGDFSFGQLLLNFVLTYVVQVIILGILFLSETLIRYNEDETNDLEEVLKEKLEQAKKAIFKEENQKDTNAEDTEEEVEKIDANDEKDDDEIDGK